MTPTTEQLKKLVAELQNKARVVSRFGVTSYDKAADALQAWIAEREKAEPVARINVFNPVYGEYPQLFPLVDLSNLPLGTHDLFTSPPHVEREKAEPVAWFNPQSISSFITNAEKVRNEYMAIPNYTVALYTSPPDLDSLRADADRYRWLRNIASPHWPIDVRRQEWIPAPVEIDAAIDEARKGGV